MKYQVKNIIQAAKDGDNMSKFTDGKPRTATKEDLEMFRKADKDSNVFRCGMCGHCFEEGDYWRWQYSNDVPGTVGNFIVCESCDCDPVILKKKWRVKAVKWKEMLDGEYWYFHKTMQNKP